MARRGHCNDCGKKRRLAPYVVWVTSKGQVWRHELMLCFKCSLRRDVGRM